MSYTFYIPRGTLAKVLALLIAGLLLASLTVALYPFLFDFGQGFITLVGGFVAMNEEANLPTWFSSGLLLLVALVLAAIGLARRAIGARYVPHWLGLSLIFFYLSLDEMTQLHEKWGRLLPDALDPKILYGWTVVGFLIVLAVGLIYFRFLRALTPETRRLFMLAGALYIGGALGFEVIASYSNFYMGEAVYDVSLWRIIITHIEETMELAGIVVFLYALLQYIDLHIGSACITPAAGVQRGQRG